MMHAPCKHLGGKVDLNLIREGAKLKSKNHSSITARKAKAEKINVKDQKFSQANDQQAKYVMEAALEVRGEAPKYSVSKLPKETKGLIKKC